MMKRICSILLSLLLAVSLSACGGGEIQDEPPRPPAGEEGEYFEGQAGEAMHPYWFDFTVNSAYACRSFGGYIAGEGKRLVVVSLSVTNACGFTVDMYREDFQIEWDGADGGGYALALSAGDVENDGVFPNEYALAAGESREGLLVYEAPASDCLDYYITFLEVFDDGTEEGQEGGVFVVRFTARAEDSAAI